MIKAKMISKSIMVETNMAEIQIWREILNGWHSKKQRKTNTNGFEMTHKSWSGIEKVSQGHPSNF